MNRLEELESENKKLKERIKNLEEINGLFSFISEKIDKDQDGFVILEAVCNQEDKDKCLSFPDRCESPEGKCRIKINLSKLQGIEPTAKIY